MKVSATGKERNRGSNPLFNREIAIRRHPWDPSWSQESKSWEFTIEGYSHLYRVQISAEEVLCLLGRAMLDGYDRGSHERAHVQSVMAYLKEVLMGHPQPATWTTKQGKQIKVLIVGEEVEEGVTFYRTDEDDLIIEHELEFD